MDFLLMLLPNLQKPSFAKIGCFAISGLIPFPFSQAFPNVSNSVKIQNIDYLEKEIYRKYLND